MNPELVGEAHPQEDVVASLDAAKRRRSVDMADGHPGLTHGLANESGLNAADLGQRTVAEKTLRT